MSCDRCGAEIQPGDVYCQQCGVSLVDPDVPGYERPVGLRRSAKSATGGTVDRMTWRRRKTLSESVLRATLGEYLVASVPEETDVRADVKARLADRHRAEQLPDSEDRARSASHAFLKWSPLVGLALLALGATAVVATRDLLFSDPVWAVPTVGVFLLAILTMVASVIRVLWGTDAGVRRLIQLIKAVRGNQEGSRQHRSRD